MKRAAWTLALALQAGAQAPQPTFEETLAKVTAYQVGDDQKPLADLDRIVATGSSSPDRAKQMEALLLASLEKATPAGKDQICRRLSLVGSAASVPVLARMLSVAETADMARYALERIPGPAVSQALRDALTKTSGNVQAGIANTLGVRKDAAAVSALRGLISSKDAIVAGAAAAALGNIANPPALAALAAGLPKTADAYLHAAELLQEKGDNQRAFAIFKQLNAAAQPEMIRIGALRGVALSGGKDAIPLLTAAIQSGESKIQAQAIRHLSAISGPEATAALVQTLPNLETMGQVRTLSALADRGDTSVLPVFLNSAKDPSQAVRVAAVQGLGKIGDASVVAILAQAAAQDNAGPDAYSEVRTGGFPNERSLPPSVTLTEAGIARESLYRLRGADVDRAIVAGMSAVDPKVKVELMLATAARGINAATPTLLAGATDANRDVRRAALRALRDTAKAADGPAIVDLLVKSQPADRPDLARVLSAALKRSDAASVTSVMSAYQSASDAEVRATLLTVLGQVGKDESLPVLRGALHDSNPELRRGAILALSEWPSSMPAQDLLAVAGSDAAPAHQILALQGYLKLVALPNTRPAAETVRMLASAMSLAKRVDEKRSILSQVQRIFTPEALALAESAAKDPETSSEGRAAVEQIQRRLRR